MGIFNQRDKIQKHTETSLITAGCSVKGNFEIEGNCHIDGFVEGNIFSQQTVSIGVNGSVKGFISAQSLIVSGKFTGQINCDSLELLSTGEINADIRSNYKRLETGCQFSGYSHKPESRDFYNILPKEVFEYLESHQLMDLTPTEEVEEVEDSEEDLGEIKKNNEK